jgi:hypothetical protein
MYSVHFSIQGFVQNSIGIPICKSRRRITEFNSNHCNTFIQSNLLFEVMDMTILSPLNEYISMYLTSLCQLTQMICTVT